MSDDLSNVKRTIRNWMSMGVITPEDAKSILDSGKVDRKKEKFTLIPYSQLKVWEVV